MLTITNEDNMALMARYPDKYFDLAIVDPPYGIGMGKNPLGYRKRVNQLTKHAPKNWDIEIPKPEYFAELFRVSKNQIVFVGNYFAHLLPPSMGWIVYDKLFEAHVSFSDFELAWSSFNRAAKKFRLSYKITKNNVTRRLSHKPNAKIHPTQKPVQLYKWLLDIYAVDGDSILDTHLGSGSIAIACHDYGYDLTACELDKDYYEAAMKRINNHISQQKIAF